MSIRTAKEWKSLASNYQESELAQEEWCKRNIINLYTFRDRLSKMKKCNQEAVAKPTKAKKLAKVEYTNM